MAAPWPQIWQGRWSVTDACRNGDAAAVIVQGAEVVGFGSVPSAPQPNNRMIHARTRTGAAEPWWHRLQ
jgi:hypothetical protein